MLSQPAGRLGDTLTEPDPRGRTGTKTQPTGFVHHLLWQLFHQASIVDGVLDFINPASLNAFLIYPARDGACPVRVELKRGAVGKNVLRGMGTFVDDVVREAETLRPPAENLANLLVYSDDGQPWDDDHQTRCSIAVLPEPGPDASEEKLKTVCMLGAAGVGKSCLTARYAYGFFEENYEPTLEDVAKKKFTIDGRETFIDILDTAGAEDFWLLMSSWFARSDFFVLVCDITSPETVTSLERYYDALVEYFESKSEPCPGFVVAANKRDLREDDELDEGIEDRIREQTVVKWGCPDSRVILTSAKTGYNVTELYVEAVRTIRSNTLRTNDEKTRTQGCACQIL